MAEYPFKDLLPLDEVLEREGYYRDWTHLDPEVFYSLTQISEYIKTKGFGVDVRLLIAQLAEHFSLKTTQVVDLGNLLQDEHATLKQQVQQAVAQVNADRDALETQFNQSVAQMEAEKDAVIANATVDSEVILARGGKATLGERLDDTTAQLAHIGKLNLLNAVDVPNGSGLSPILSDGSDNVIKLQNIINYASENFYEGVYIPYSDYPFMFNGNHTGATHHLGLGVHLKSNMTLKIHPKTILKSLPSPYSYQVLLNVYDVENVVIEGGTLEGERDSHGVEVNEFAYGLYIWGSENISVKNVISKDFWGDGFTTRDIETKIENDYLQPCKNILFDNITSDNNCRQGLSIISGKGVKVLNSTFSNTNGTAPQAGIDIEPNYSTVDKKVENVEIVNCNFFGNVGNSIVVTNAIDVKIERSKFSGERATFPRTCKNIKLVENEFIGTGVIAECDGFIMNENKFISSEMALIFDNVTIDSVYKISKNKFLDCERIISSTSSSIYEVTFNDNYFKNATEYFSIMSGQPKNVHFIGNTFEGNLVSCTMNVSQSKIINNRFKNNAEIVISGSVNSQIKGNHFVDSIAVPSKNTHLIIASNSNGLDVDGNTFFVDNSILVEPLSVTASERALPVVVKNNLSYKPTTYFDSSVNGVVFLNNYSV